MIRRTVLPQRVAIVVLVATNGCSNDSRPSGDRLCTVVAPLVGGAAAEETRLDAIGTIGTVTDTGEFMPVCSATLIGPSTVLSAKHCSVGFVNANREGGGLGGWAFALGWNAREPYAVYPIVQAITMDPSTGGFTGLGADVVVMTTDAPIVDVEPIPPIEKRIDVNRNGEAFMTYGFGSTSSDERSSPWRRRGGRVRLWAVSGNIFEILYGSYEAFVDAVRSEALLGARVPQCGTLASEDEGLLSEVYRAGELQPRVEAWLVGDPEDGAAQTCFGDSGGPLVVDAESDAPRVAGVVSWSWRSGGAACDHGTVYSLVDGSSVGVNGGE